MYGQALAYALQKNRPEAEVVRVEPEDLDGDLGASTPSWSSATRPPTG